MRLDAIVAATSFLLLLSSTLAYYGRTLHYISNLHFIHLQHERALYRACKIAAAIRDEDHVPRVPGEQVEVLLLTPELETRKTILYYHDERGGPMGQASETVFLENGTLLRVKVKHLSPP